FVFEAHQDEGVDRIGDPGGVLDRRRRPILGWDERPMLAPLGAVLDPLPERRDLIGGELLAAVGGRHVLLGAGAGDAFGQLAVIEVAGDDGAVSVVVGLGGFFGVEAEVGFALFLVGAVTGVTVLGEDRF